MNFHYNGEVTLGNIFTVAAFLAAVGSAWINLNWRVKNIETWKTEHFHSTKEALDNISLLQANVVKLTALLEGQDRRLVLLEEKPLHFRAQ